MTDQVDFEQSLVYGRKALQYMRDRRSPASPRNYELWYTYSCGQRRDLIKAVNDVVAQHGVLEQSDCDEIYRQFLAPRENQETVSKIGAQMSDEISQVLAMVDVALGNTSEYGDSLGSVSEKLAGSVDGPTLAIIVESLVEKTREMEQSNRQLEDRLQDTKSQITELSDNLEEVRNESRTDQLTGIANRKFFDEEISSQVGEASETGDELCLLIGDIDFFKKFNDTWGHQTGDQVLRLVAQAPKASVKGRDLAVRYGGEEFAVILPQTNLQSAVAVANQIREAVKAKELVKKSTGENLGTITMSFGAARFHVGDSVDDLVHRADACLYAAKKGGRNCVKCETDPNIDLEIEAA